MNEVAPVATTLRAIILELLALDFIEDEDTKINQILQEYENKRT